MRPGPEVFTVGLGPQVDPGKAFPFFYVGLHFPRSLILINKK